MGLTVGPIVTPQGFQVNALYIRIVTFRILLTQGNTSSYHCIFSYEGFKSYEDKVNGYSPLSIPEELRQAETIVNVLDFLRKDIFEIGYNTLKSRLAGSSYTVNDIHEPSQYKGSDYRFNRSGYDVDGFNPDGFNAAGYDKDGFNAQGYDSEGYDRDGYNAQGYNRQGFNQSGFDKDGYDYMGYNQAGLDIHGNPRPTITPLEPAE
jgi:hypothetical protein